MRPSHLDEQPRATPKLARHRDEGLEEVGSRGNRFQRIASLLRADDLEHAQPLLDAFADIAECP
jgi:hypothetical protein